MGFSGETRMGLNGETRMGLNGETRNRLKWRDQEWVSVERPGWA